VIPRLIVKRRYITIVIFNGRKNNTMVKHCNAITAVRQQKNSVRDKAGNIRGMRHPSSAVWCRGMYVTIQWLEKIRCLPLSIPTTRSPDNVVWSRSHQLHRIHSTRVIISCRRLGIFRHVARLDSGVPARDDLECVYARCTEIRPPSGWRIPPGRPRQTWL